tara:strand:- start:3156 stop:5204 length:2049 start_codon:yes stop_codon:yes gene_type:complete
MQKLQLFISGERVDLFKDESVSITQTIQNVKDIAKIFTEFTQSFSVPASKTNNKLFKHYYNFDIDNAFDARNKVSAEIQLNYIPFKKGFIKLEGVQMKKNKAYAYKITFFGNTVNLKDVLGESELNDLAKLNDYDTDYSYSSISSGINAGLSNLCVPLISHTRQLYYDTNASNYGAGNLYWIGTGGYSGANGVYWSDLKYAIRLERIIDAITSEYSSISFSDDFFNTSNAEFYNLYMWLHRKKGDVEPEITVEPTYKRVPSFSLTSSPPATTTMTSGALVISSSLVTYPNSITGFTLSLTPTSNLIQYNIRVERNGSLAYQSLGVTGAQVITNSNFTLSSGSYTVHISTVSNTDTIAFNNQDIYWEIDGNIGGEVISGSWTDTWKASSFSSSTTIPFNIQAQIPKMKIIDFLSAIFKMFNLTAYVDDTDTIVVQKLDAYYSASSVTHNINEYVDVNESTVDVALPYNQIEFKYNGTGTFLAKQFEQLNNREWGSLKYSADSEFSAPASSYKVEVPFEHQQYNRLGTTDIQWGWSVDDSKQSYLGLPLIFYAIQQSSATQIPLKQSASANALKTTYVIPSNSLSLSSGTSKINLNYGSEANEYTDGFTFDDGSLFQQNYITYIQSVFEQKKRLTKVKAYLPLKIIYNLKLNDKISLNNYTYKINSITTNLTTGESSLELLNEV